MFDNPPCLTYPLNYELFKILQYFTYNLLEERILILDGAMGTMIQKYKIKGNNDLLILDPASNYQRHPQPVP